jgi:hypothetical protein
MNWLFIFVLAMAASYIVQMMLRSRFTKYSKVPTPDNMTGAEVAEKMLRDNGIYDVKVVSIPGALTDNYNPSNKTLNLSEAVYGHANIAAAAVAAHECGHAIQDAMGYAPLRMRSALVPVVNFANNAVMWVLFIGFALIQFTSSLLWLGIALFAVGTLFSLITLPVEINASCRAVDWLEDNQIVHGQTKVMATDALRWAAYTYVIAAITSLATLFYYISIASSRR